MEEIKKQRSDGGTAGGRKRGREHDKTEGREEMLVGREWEEGGKKGKLGRGEEEGGTVRGTERREEEREKGVKRRRETGRRKGGKEIKCKKGWEGKRKGR